MMKIADIAKFSVAGVVVMLAAGCVDLAQVNYGPDELRWQQALRESYPGYRPPRTPPPAGLEAGNDVVEVPVDMNATPAAAEDDPNKVVDQAANGDLPEFVEEKPVAPAAKPEVKLAPASATAKPVAPAPKAEPLDPTMAKNVYVVKPGDDLSRIAQKFYGNGNCYDPIVKANSDLISNPNKLKPGMKLIIPAL